MHSLVMWPEFWWIWSFKVKVSWNVMAHAQKPRFVFRRNGRVHLNGRGRQFSRLLAAELCASEVIMLDTPCSEVVWKALATHSIRQIPLYFTSPTSPWVITFQLESTCSLRTSRQYIRLFAGKGWYGCGKKDETLHNVMSTRYIFWKREAKCGVDHSFLSSAQFEERVQPYQNYLYGHSCRALGWIILF